MKAYSEDLRRNIVDAVSRGASKSETAGLFGVSLSSVKRFTRMEREGDSLAPKKPPGRRPPKGTDATRRVLLADLAERPAPSAPERRRYLERMTGESMSDSTVRRLVKRLGHSRKKDRPSPPSATSSGGRPLAGDGLGEALRQKARVLKDEMGSSTSLHELYAYCPTAERAYCSVARNLKARTRRCSL